MAIGRYLGAVTLVIGHTWNGVEIAANERVELTLRLTDAAIRIDVDAPFHGDPPPPGPPGPSDGLWDYEVVELFISGAATPDEVPYTEVELSPHGHHLVLRLSGVRNVVEKVLPLEFEATISGGRWSGTAWLPRSYLPPAPWNVNAYAIHGQESERRYLAMSPVPGKGPDFHRPEVFQPLELGR